MKRSTEAHLPSVQYSSPCSSLGPTPGFAGKSNSHPGNVRLREFAERWKHHYQGHLKNAEKAPFARWILDLWRNDTDPRGRVLRQEQDGTWRELTDEKAVKVIMGILRRDPDQSNQALPLTPHAVTSADEIPTHGAVLPASVDEVTSPRQTQDFPTTVTEPPALSDAVTQPRPTLPQLPAPATLPVSYDFALTRPNMSGLAVTPGFAPTQPIVSVKRQSTPQPVALFVPFASSGEESPIQRDDISFGDLPDHMTCGSLGSEKDFLFDAAQLTAADSSRFVPTQSSVTGNRTPLCPISDDAVTLVDRSLGNVPFGALPDDISFCFRAAEEDLLRDAANVMDVDSFVSTEPSLSVNHQPPLPTSHPESPSEKDFAHVTVPPASLNALTSLLSTRPFQPTPDPYCFGFAPAWPNVTANRQPLQAQCSPVDALPAHATFGARTNPAYMSSSFLGSSLPAAPLAASSSSTFDATYPTFEAAAVNHRDDADDDDEAPCSCAHRLDAADAGPSRNASKPFGQPTVPAAAVELDAYSGVRPASNVGSSRQRNPAMAFFQHSLPSLARRIETWLRRLICGERGEELD
jgi:hypothetical protein